MTEIETYPYDKLTAEELDAMASVACGINICQQDKYDNDIDVCFANYNQNT